MTTDIQHLISKYFEGDTSSSEEKYLRDYFVQNENLPEELEEYAPLFRFLHDEAEALAILNEIKQESALLVPRKSLLWRRVSAVAAIAASLLIAVLLLTHPHRSVTTNGNYVWVDGKQITDPATVRQHAEASFGRVETEDQIIEDQLRLMFE